MDLKSIKGIGEKSEKLLNKLGIITPNDLIEYYPYRYNIYNFSDLKDGDNIVTLGVIESNPMVSYIKRNFNRLSFRCNINKNIVNVVIFNRAFLKNNIKIGSNVCLIGKYDKRKNQFLASDIKFNVKNGDIESVYHLTKGLNNNFISKTVLNIIDKCKPKDLIPEYLENKYNFLNKKEALIKIHFPSNVKEIKDAKIRLIYEELFEFSFKMNFLNNEIRNSKGSSKLFDENLIEEAKATLPFKLTEDQESALNEVLLDLKQDKKMNRLLLGDVGSGKTIVSALAIYACVLSGYQAALMAPTEILANQHFFSIKKVLDKFNVKIDIITGSMTKKEKKTVYDNVSNGNTDLIIGTHALLSDEMNFKNLGLVVTDEQHRFGVNQRGILQNKANMVDVLYLSATPIPRTYALTIYGDLDISMIKTKPAGRKEIITKVYKEKEIKEVLTSMLDEMKKGHQIYVVSPLVEDSDILDLTSVKKLKENLDKAFNKKVRCEIIHGKLKQNEKDAIMNDFKNNKIQILISTTVIEVGIDNPNATMMVIFNAERFGLATLHQLRGRVGRGDAQSYCNLISDEENERLKVMEESNDGFVIAQKDFDIRGHGDLFGVRQHGDMTFKLANLKSDYKVLVQAKNDANEYIKNKLYLDNDYYKKLADDLDITD